MTLFPQVDADGDAALVVGEPVSRRLEAWAIVLPLVGGAAASREVRIVRGVRRGNQRAVGEHTAASVGGVFAVSLAFHPHLQLV